MCDCIDLWAPLAVLCVDQRVRKPIEVKDSKLVIHTRAAPLVLDDEIANALVLCKKCLGDDSTDMGGIVDRGVAELGLGLRM